MVSIISTLIQAAWSVGISNGPGAMPKGMNRSWEPGKGHAGVAFTREGDLVYGDAQDPIVQQLIDPGDQAGANDKYYRSVASIPIFDPTNSVLGVVIATSNRKGRFMPDQKAEIEPLRDWAKFNANLIARQR